MQIKDVLQKLKDHEISAQEAKAQIQQFLSGKRPFLPSTSLNLEAAQQYVLKVAAQVLKFEESQLKLTESFESYGIDSIVSMRLIDAFEKDLGPLSKTLFFEYRSFEELSLHFFQHNLDGLSRTLQALPVQREPAAPILIPRTEPPPSSAEIAVIGLSGKYPKSPHLQAFWENLKRGFNGIGPIPLERWDVREFYDPKRSKQGTVCTSLGGFIEGAEEFDNLLFQIMPSEAKVLDPQDRLFLQATWEALEDAGYTREKIRELTGGEVGVYAGIMTNDYSLLSAHHAGLETDAFSNGIIAEVANRTSYFFDFHGPSMTINTMCSSSLTAIYLAYEGLRHKQMDLAIAGGVNLTLHPNKYLVLSENKFLSPDGLCKSFGEGGKGYIPSEGCGVAVLKRLEDAIRDKDPIYGVIKAAAVNNCGRSSRYRVPMAKAQAKVIEKALSQAQIDPRTITCLEAHGTGTELGDPIEVEGLVEVFRKKTADTQFCSLGSVKSNIGHTEGAAGIASLTKVLLEMKHKTLVPTIHSEKPNPNIRFETTPFYLQKDCQSWNLPNRDVPRRAGIPSYGAGGANAFIVVEEYPEKKLSEVSSPTQHIFLLSAASKNRLKQYIEKLLPFLDRRRDHPSYFSESDFQTRLLYTYQVGREAMHCRLACSVKNLEELRDQLARFQADLPSQCLYAESHSHASYQAGDLMQEWVNGKNVKWEGFWPSKPMKINAPTYPFERKKFWIDEKPLVFKEQQTESLPVFTEQQYPSLFAIPAWEESEGKSTLAMSLPKILVYPAALRSFVDRYDLRKGVVAELELPIYRTAQDACEALKKMSAWMQEILKSKKYTDLSIVALSEESVYWQNGYLHGFLQSLSQEKPSFKSRIVQIGKGGEKGLPLWWEKEWEKEDAMVLYEEKQRKVWRYRTIQEKEGTQFPLVKEGGVYWIIGGVGGLGQIFARHMNQLGKKMTLILSGRSSIEKEKLQRLQEEVGSVSYKVCDIARRESVEETVKILLQEHGKLDGIIHAGGVLRDSWLIRKNLDQLFDVLNPKILGVENLDEATRQLPLDYVIFCSSEAGAFGNIGQTDYAAANSFMDAFAKKRSSLREKGERQGKTLSINWPYWKEGGMRISSDIQQKMFEMTGEVPLETEKGTRGLSVMLGLSSSQAIIFQGDVKKIEQTYSLLEPLPELSASRSCESAIEVDILTQVRQMFSRVSQMDLSEIQDDVPFQEYGADSVSLSDLARQLAKTYNQVFDLSLFFEHPTIHDVAKEISLRLRKTDSDSVLPSPPPSSDWMESPQEIETTYVQTLTGEEPYLREHKLLSRPLLPAAIYFEFLMEIGKRFLKTAISVKKSTFLAPLYFDGKPLQLFLTVTGEEVQFWTRNVKGEKVLLMKGEIERGEPSRKPFSIPSLGSPRHIWSSEQIYTLLKEIGFEYGPTFQSVKKVHVYPKYLQVFLELPASVKEKDAMVPYSILDGALHAMIGFHTIGTEEENEAPYSLKGFSLYRNFPQKVRVFVEKVADCSYRLEFYTEEGELIAEFKEVETASLTKEKGNTRKVGTYEGVIREKIASMLNLSYEAVDPNLPLSQLGIGNFEAIRLQTELQKLYSIALPFSMFRKSETLRDFIENFEQIIRGEMDSDIQNLSDAEAEALLEKELV